VFKNHAFIYFLRPPSWSGTVIFIICHHCTVLTITVKSVKIIFKLWSWKYEWNIVYSQQGKNWDLWQNFFIMYFGLQDTKPPPCPLHLTGPLTKLPKKRLIFSLIFVHVLPLSYSTTRRYFAFQILCSNLRTDLSELHWLLLKALRAGQG
jgi:hypothetical protein